LASHVFKLPPSKLSKREHEAVQLLSNTGWSYLRIAHAMGVKESTVKYWMQVARQKMNVRNRVEMVVKFTRSVG